MRVKIRSIGPGLHPNEVIVEVQTLHGAERLVVDKRAISASSVSVGAPLREDKGNRLIELPRETLNGLWRVWVKPDALARDSSARAA